jgi:hypothetical protein
MIRSRRLNLLGLVALGPLMLSLPASVAARVLHLPLCGGDGVVRMVEVPVGGGDAPARDEQCCPKGCHAGCSRKRALGETGLAQ